MRAGVVGAISLFALIGCLSDPPAPRRLTVDDITAIPPGTATGSYFSGNYQITSGQVEACSCRVGNCATVRVQVGTILTVAQTAGVIQIGGTNSTEICSGGVDADGSFHCNGQVIDAVTNTTEFVVATGQFVFSNGAASSFHQSEEITAILPMIDCDIRGNMTAQFVGAAFLGANVSAAPPDHGDTRLPGSFAFGVGP